MVLASGQGGQQIGPSALESIQAAGESFSSLTTSTQLVEAAFSRTQSSLDGLVGFVNTSLLKGAFGPLETATASFAGGLTSLTEGVSGFYGQLQSAGSSMGQFVQLFSPSLMLPFQQGMRDLGALIGSALAPAFEVLTSVVKGVGANLAPVFDRLREIITPLAQVMGNVFLVIVKSISNSFQAMAPLIEMVVRTVIPLIEGLAAMSEAVSIVVTSVIGAFTAGLDPKKNGLVSFAESVRSFMQQLAKGIILVVAAIAKFFGAEGIIKALEANLAPQAKGARDIGGSAAAQGAQFSTFAELGRRMALAASIATGGSGVDKAAEQRKWQEDTLAELKKMKAEPLFDTLTRWTKPLAKALGDALAEAVREVPGFKDTEKTKLRASAIITAIRLSLPRFLGGFGGEEE